MTETDYTSHIWSSATDGQLTLDTTATSELSIANLSTEHHLQHRLHWDATAMICCRSTSVTWHITCRSSEAVSPLYRPNIPSDFNTLMPILMRPILACCCVCKCTCTQMSTYVNLVTDNVIAEYEYHNVSLVKPRVCPCKQWEQTQQFRAEKTPGTMITHSLISGMHH